MLERLASLRMSFTKIINKGAFINHVNNYLADFTYVICKYLLTYQKQSTRVTPVTPASKHVLYSADEYKGLAMSADHGLLLTENTS